LREIEQAYTPAYIPETRYDAREQGFEAAVREYKVLWSSALMDKKNKGGT